MRQTFSAITEQRINDIDKRIKGKELDSQLTRVQLMPSCAVIDGKIIVKWGDAGNKKYEAFYDFLDDILKPMGFVRNTPIEVKNPEKICDRINFEIERVFI